MQIGYIGLGKMGKNMAFHLSEMGWDLIAYNRSKEVYSEVESAGVKTAQTYEDLINSINPPRLVWVMVSHAAVDAVLDEIVPLLSKDDVVIDGGNSFYKQSIERAEKLSQKGIR